MPRKYGWKNSKPDQRDLIYRSDVSRDFPSSVDLRGEDDPIYDQGQLGSCVGNGCGEAWQFALRKESKTFPLPARLLVYYFGRMIEGTVAEDSGLEIRDGMKALAKYGCCDELLWPYNISKFTQKPAAKAVKEAAKHKAAKYLSVNQNFADMKQCLADGYPIVIGFTVYESFESAAVAKTGKVPMPKKKEKTLGGHCVVVVGYDDVRGVFIVRNSWGAGWGDKGYCYFPYAYLLNENLASDFWTVRTIN